ncbi:MAG: hypothetical protein ACM3RP_01135 [Chitinophagales bacterium]
MAAFLLLLLALSVGVPAGKKVCAFLRTEPATYGRLRLSVEGEALVVRREQVLFSDLAGKVEPVAGEGERVARGALVARVAPGAPEAGGEDHRAGPDRALAETERRAILDEQSPLAAKPAAAGASSQALRRARSSREAELRQLTAQRTGQAQRLRAPLAGTVSYYTDGLEGVLGPRSLPDLVAAKESVTELARSVAPVEAKAGAQVKPGVPVAKVVDNFQVWLVVDLPPGSGGRALPGAGGRLRLRLRGEGRPESAEANGVVLERHDGKDRVRLVISPVEYWPELAQLRTAAVQLSLGEFEGVRVPRTSVIKEDGTQGVMVESWRGRQFQAVTVRGGDREWLVVDGLAPGTRVWSSVRR